MAKFEVDDDFFFSSAYSNFEMSPIESTIHFKEINTQSNNNNSTISDIEEEEIASDSPFKPSTTHKLFQTVHVSQARTFTKSKPKGALSYATGRWKAEECVQFMRGLLQYGIQWQRILSFIPTRSIEQIRSHAQKFFGVLRKAIKPSEDNNLVDAAIHSYFVQALHENIQPRRGFYDILRSAIFKDSLQPFTAQKGIVPECKYFYIEKQAKPPQVI